ncbi:hypothetical protein HK107_06435 [Parvularcula sp. ZS-1/3]|uniref:Cytochrome c domain-containing protein n=1 Tax=Parvularcula mediterranea TaxID=2732508 RepID=A0A7Y3RKW1_9PROT|nr:SO2930 family diheme c-type cytochrome [Parvularcula mediterranea]NNU15958.1 hypothetical protein [Parvularcula mediterranea]
MKRALLAIAMLLSACGEKAVEPVFFPDENPQLLSDWGAVSVDRGELRLGEGVTPYALRTPLFTDYAHKLRTVWSVGEATPRGDWAPDFPVGTVLTKTFYYPESGSNVLKAEDMQPVNGTRGLDLAEHRLIETRLLVRRSDGWHALSYVWNEDETEARLKRTGAVVPLTLASSAGEEAFPYIVPNENQCASCHIRDATDGGLEPLGPTEAQLDHPYGYAGGEANQLAAWRERGLLVTTGYEPSSTDPLASLDGRARAYLAANCAHCHNPVGPADTSGMDLTLSADGPALGHCKPPIAAGSGTGGRRFGIVPGAPDQSVLTYRVASRDPGAMMPEVGRSLVDEEGLALLEEWIGAMDGACS